MINQLLIQLPITNSTGKIPLKSLSIEGYFADSRGNISQRYPFPGHGSSRGQSANSRASEIPPRITITGESISLILLDKMIVGGVLQPLGVAFIKTSPRIGEMLPPWTQWF